MPFSREREMRLGTQFVTRQPELRRGPVSLMLNGARVARFPGRPSRP